MGNVRTWATVILIATSFINLVLGLILVVQAENKRWPIFIIGGTLVSLNACFALVTACLGIEWVLWLVSFVSLILSIYLAVLISYYIHKRHPEHEERLWTYFVNSGEIHNIEREHFCCGRDGPNYYTDREFVGIPRTCYAFGFIERNEVFQKGCFYLMEEKSKLATSQLLHYMLAITIIGFIHGVIAQILAILLLARNQIVKYHNAAADRAFRRAVNEMHRRHEEPTTSDESYEIKTNQKGLQDPTKNKYMPETELSVMNEGTRPPNQLAVQNKFPLKTQSTETLSGSHDKAKTKAEVHDEPAPKAKIESTKKEFGTQTISNLDTESSESDSSY